jgi:hypothetical protein
MPLCLQVKKTISKDPRYDAVGSSSLRTELFNTFLTARSNQPVPDPNETQAINPSPSERSDDTQKRKDRKAEAVRERGEKVKAEQERIQATIEKSRSGLNREEGELQFRCAATTHSRFCKACAGAYRTIILQDPSDRCHTRTTGTRDFIPRQYSDQSCPRRRGIHPLRN